MYEAIHYTLFSYFVLLSVIKVYGLISTIPKPSLQSSLNVTTKCQPTPIKILHKHTQVYTAIATFMKAGRRAKLYEAAQCISTNSFPLNFFILLFVLLNATLK